MKTKFTNYSFSRYLLRMENGMSKHDVAQNDSPVFLSWGKIILFVAMFLTVPFAQSAINQTTIVADEVSQIITWENPSNITYGTALSATQLNATVIEGAGALTYTPGLGTILSAGTHTLKVTAAATDNYDETSKEVTIVVDKANPEITIESSSTTSTYGESVTFTVTASGFGGNAPTGNVTFRCVAAVLGTDTLIQGKATLITSRLEANDTHSPNALYLGDDNYNSVTSNYLSHYVSKKTLTISAENKSKSYDGAIYSDDYTISFSGFVNAENETILNGILMFTGEAITATSVGLYDIIPSGLTASNYEITFINGKLNIIDVSTNTNNIEQTKLTVTVYPNPSVSDYVNFKFGLKEASKVSIYIFDTKGLLIDCVFSENIQDNDIHTVTYKNNLPTGTYIYRLKSGSEVITGKLVIVK